MQAVITITAQLRTTFNNLMFFHNFLIKKGRMITYSHVYQRVTFDGLLQVSLTCSRKTLKNSKDIKLFYQIGLLLKNRRFSPFG